jgi:membrane protease YdiL (CAAX protease family)
VTTRTPTPPAADAVPAAAALGLLGTAVLLLVAAAPVVYPLGLAGVALAQLVFFGAPPLLLARVARDSARAPLGLVRPPAAAVAGALLVGATFWYLQLSFVVPLSQRLVGGDDDLRRLGELLAPGGALWAQLLALALMPAVCEELLVRGAVARALRPRLGLLGAIAVSALLFGAMHLSPARFFPQVAFGAVLAYAALISGSVVTAIVMHLTNNALAILLATGRLEGLAASLEANPVPWLTIAAAGSAAGLALLWSSRPKNPTVTGISRKGRHNLVDS